MNTRKITLALLAATGVAILLDFARGGILRSTSLAYLVWNLFLAWVPYLITAYGIKKGASLARFVPLFVLWLLFFPNAPYMVTDVIHVASGVHHVWLDALEFFFFAWIALMLAAISLREMHSFLRERMSRAWSEVSVIAICALASFGVYLGRFQRWNSWDIFTRPWALLSHSYAISASIGNDSTPLLFVAIFTAFMYTVYSVMTAILSAHRQS